MKTIKEGVTAIWRYKGNCKTREIEAAELIATSRKKTPKKPKTDQ